MGPAQVHSRYIYCICLEEASHTSVPINKCYMVLLLKLALHHVAISPSPATFSHGKCVVPTLNYKYGIGRQV